MDIATLTTLRARWDALTDQYTAQAADADSRTIRARFSDGEAYHPIPAYFERVLRARRGRIFERDPGAGYDVYQYGMDKARRIVAVGHFGEGDTPITEIFYSYKQGYVEIAQYRGRTLIRLAHLHRKRRRPTALYAITMIDGAPQTEQEIYTFEDGQLIRVEREQDDGVVNRAEVQTLIYEDDDDLLRIESAHTDRAPDSLNEWTETIYQREDVRIERELLRDAQAELTAAIPAALRSSQISEPLYALILRYSASRATDAPALLIGYDADRAAWIADGGDPQALWTPAPPTPTRDPAVPLMGALPGLGAFAQYITTANKPERYAQLMRAAAKTLMKRAWGDTLNVTDDFVIAAIDYESDDLEEAMRASVPARRVDQLEQKGWL